MRCASSSKFRQARSNSLGRYRRGSRFSTEASRPCQAPARAGASALGACVRPLLEILEEGAVRRKHEGGVSLAQSGFIGLHRAIEGGEAGVLAKGLGEDAGAQCIALAA